MDELAPLLESWQERPRCACIGPSHETKPAGPAPAVFQLGIAARRRSRLSIAAMREATAKSRRFLRISNSNSTNRSWRPPPNRKNPHPPPPPPPPPPPISP